MYVLLWIIILLLFIALLVERQRRKMRTSELRELNKKLGTILTESKEGSLRFFTGDRALIELINEINRLLEFHRQTLASHARMEESMRKMISNISHDLKTPLTVILGYLEMIRIDQNMEAKEREHLLDKVHLKTNEVMEFIQKFFDLAKLEAGDKEIPLAEVQMNELCRMRMLQFYDVLTSKGFEVHLDIPDSPLYAYGNEEALHRVLNNLISNAIRYGSDGGVVGLRLAGDGKKVTVEVWDRGKGIGEVDANRIFERLVTLEDSRNKSFQGSGLGLTITKRLIEAMEGRIHLYSKPYEKTVFTFELNQISRLRNL